VSADFHLILEKAMQLFGLKKLVISQSSREKLLATFPPLYNAKSEHITLEFGALNMSDIDLSGVEIVGYQKTSYLEVLVVSINGSITRSSDKQILHCTHSLKDGIAPVCSNDVLNELLYQPVNPIKIEVLSETQYFN
jgi:hypothetical protein